MSHINIRIGKLPGVITSIVLEDTACRVSDALSAAGLDATGFDVRVNSAAADLDTRLTSGDTVLLVTKIKGNAGHITVRVGKLPGVISEIALNGDRKVSTALTAAGLDAAGFDVRVNSSAVSLDHELSQGDTVLLVTKIKGNAGHITVRVGKLPGVISEIALNGDRKVSTALAAAGLDAAGFDVRVNSSAVSLDHELSQGDTVLLVTKIKGNAGHITVRVGKLPGVISEIALNGDRKVSTALTAAGLDAAGFDVRVNSSAVSLDHELSQGDTVLLVTKIKGNDSK